MQKFELNQKVKMKKPHPCGANLWEIIRLGADIKIKCLNCGRSVMLPRVKFEKKAKKILTEAEVNKELEQLKSHHNKN